MTAGQLGGDAIWDGGHILRQDRGVDRGRDEQSAGNVDVEKRKEKEIFTHSTPFSP
jgi:hypothetical protein